MTETKIRPMTLVDYIDPGSGVPVKACSPDNGQTYKIYFTPWGIVWHADDVEVLWNDFLLDKVKSIMSIDWDSIKNKPKLVTQDALNERLAKLSVPTINWSDIQNKPDLSQYVTKDELPAQPDLSGYAKTSDIPKSMDWNQITDKPSLALSSDIPSLDGYAKLTDIPSVTGLVKEAELDDYAKKTDLPVIPDLTPYAKLTDLNKYALATQIPTTMAWDSITNKPTLALKSDIPSLTGYAKLTDIPSVSGLVKETELADYAKKSDLPTTMAWQNITNKPDVATQDDLKKIELMPGPKGNPGADGKDGVTPHIDTATGNWFVGSTDTGIKAQGPQGIQGVPGKDGRNGIDGKDGDRGPQGIPGKQGEPGAPGTNGKDGIDGKDGQPGRDGTDGKSAYQIWLDNGHSGTETDFLNSLKGAKGDPGQNGTNGKDGKDAPLPDMSKYALITNLDDLKATLNSSIDASKVSYEQIYPTLINGTTGSVNAFLIMLSEKVKMLAFWANVTLPTIQGWSQVDIMSFPQMYEQNHITLNQSVIPDNYHSLWADYSSTSFSLRNQTGTTVSNYSFNFFGSGIFLY